MTVTHSANITFQQLLATHASDTEAFLSETLRRHEAVPDRLRAAMRHAVLGGGKRFRPFLVIESAALLGVPTVQAMPVAAALECLHCYSLVHDDLPAMDNDTMRRGKTTVWFEFDVWTAILAGDALLTFSFELLAEAHDIPAAQRGSLVAALAKAAGPAGMVGGQTLDLMSDKLKVPAAPTLDDVRRLQAMKTGALIRFAAEAGALLGAADASQMAALRTYGQHLGVVFQIADDLLDVTGDAADVGKATGKDAAAGKATQVSLVGVDRARELLAQTEADAVAALSSFGAEADVLRAAVKFAADRAQ